MGNHRINLVAEYEAKQIRRSFIFWILTLVSILGIGALQFLLQNDKFSYPLKWSWLMYGQSFSFPLVNAYLYNLVQGFLVIFMVTDIFTREHEQGPRESLSTRPVNNTVYLLGKAWGVARVFTVVSVISILICCGMQLLSSSAPFDPLYHLFYFLTLTVPSLLYIIGLSFFLTWLTRSRMFAILLLLVYLFFSVSLLPFVFHGLFDFTGSTLSNVFSTVTGHVDGQNYLLHRLAYLFLGVGFIFLTIRLQERLPNNRHVVVRWSVSGFLLLLLGLSSIGFYARGYLSEYAVRDAYRASFQRHAGNELARVSHHAIEFEQRGDQISSKSDLTLRNPGEKELSRLLLFLNPGLTVSSVEEQGRVLPHTRDGQVLLIERRLSPGDSVQLTLCYSGVIDERVAYLDIDDDVYYGTERGEPFFHLGRRHALVSDEVMVLIPEVMWYPMAVPPVHPFMPALTSHDYTRYRLTVRNAVQPTVLSQGQKRQSGSTVEFSPALPLEGLTLCAGTYEQKSLTLEDVQVDYYHFKGGDFFLPAFQEYKLEAIEAAISSLFKKGSVKRDPDFRGEIVGYLSDEDEKKISLAKDVFIRRDWCNGQEHLLQIVETPIPFTSHFRLEEEKSGHVQPGMILMRERAMGVNLTSYYRVKKFQESKRARQMAFYDMKLDSTERMKHKMKDLIYPLANALFTIKQNISEVHPMLHGLNLNEDQHLERDFNPFCSYSLFFEPSVEIVSSRYKMIDQILKRLFRRGKYLLSSGSSSTSKDNLQAYLYLQQNTLNDAVSKGVSPKLFHEIMDVKTNSLAKWIGVYTSSEKFYHFLSSFYRSHHGEVALETLNKAMKAELGIDFDKILQAWDKRCVGEFRIVDEKIERIALKNKRYYGYMMSFKIQNIGKCEGVMFYPVDNGYRNKNLPEYRKLVLQPGECKDVRIRRSYNSCNIDFDIAVNIPAAYDIGYRLGPVTLTTRDTVQSVKDISSNAFEPSPNEIIVDNEDEGCRLIYPEKKWLQRIMQKEIKSVWNLKQQSWVKDYGADFYGDVVKSAYSKRVGKGIYKVEWSADLPEDGTYEIFVKTSDHRYKFVPEQYYTVSGEGMQETEILFVPFEVNSWNSLGQFTFKKGKSRVVLDDRIPKEGGKEKAKSLYYKEVFADAIKWVRVE